MSIDVFVKVKVLQNNIFYLRLVNDERDPCPGSVVGDLRSIVEPNNLISGDFTPGRRVLHLIRRFCSPGDQAGQVDHARGLNKHLRPSHQTRHRIWEYFEVGSSHLWPWGGPRGPCGGLSTPGTRKVLRFPSQTESSRSKHLSLSVECSSTPAASRGCASRGSPQTCSGWEKTEKGVKPEVRGVSVSPDSEEAEVLESDPGDGSVPKVANSAVQSRQVARNHSHVSRVAGEGRGDKTYSKTFWIQLVGFAK